MAKVIIYEDSEMDAVYRYSSLAKRHEIHMRIIGKMYLLDRLISGGFKPENIQEVTIDSLEREEANAYFLDGLGGICFDIISKLKLPKDRIFIQSGDWDIIKRAKSEGLGVIPVAEPIVKEAILERILENLS